MTTEKPILLGRIGAAHGIKGAVRIVSFTEDPEAIGSYGALSTDRPGLEIEIASLRPSKGVVIAQIKGISDRTAAERLNGVSLYIERDALPESEDEDEFYHADLIGLLAETPDGTALGTVIAIPNFGAGDLVEIRKGTGGESLLYPFTKAVVPRIDLDAGRMIVAPPEEVGDPTGGDADPDAPDGSP